MREEMFLSIYKFMFLCVFDGFMVMVIVMYMGINKLQL